MSRLILWLVTQIFIVTSPAMNQMNSFCEKKNFNIFRSNIYLVHFIHNASTTYLLVCDLDPLTLMALNPFIIFPWGAEPNPGSRNDKEVEKVGKVGKVTK
jgi:hypothetical protein